MSTFRFVERRVFTYDIKAEHYDAAFDRKQEVEPEIDLRKADLIRETEDVKQVDELRLENWSVSITQHYKNSDPVSASFQVAAAGKPGVKQKAWEKFDRQYDRSYGNSVEESAKHDNAHFHATKIDSDEEIEYTT